ncbi:MAG: hypothetical protein DRQ78_10090 [Epsilonproteobacteria bacterium]|nr:MAG: hypothetical protein DRQ78_10090 [Campylobacterota bacterium]
MALFGNKENVKKNSNKINSATIITSCMAVNGNLHGSDTIHIDGTVTGNITVSNTLVIGKNGVVQGNVEAKHVIINGELKGSIKCENLEVMKTGKVSKHISAKHLVLDGKVEGDIYGEESIKILENSHINATELKSKVITVNGTINGTVIASELLEIEKKGFVEGNITVKNIKTEEGGRMVGSMSTYEQSSPKKRVIKKAPKEA